MGVKGLRNVYSVESLNCELISLILPTSSAYILTYICMFGSGSVFGIPSRIQKAPEYGSGSTTLVTHNRPESQKHHLYSSI